MAYTQTTQEEQEIEAMAMTELSRLKRQYRIMENDRATYAEDTRLQLQNQQNILTRLEHEKAELILAIKLAKCPTNIKRDEEMEGKLRSLLEKRTKYINMIKNEKDKSAELDNQINKVSKEVEDLKLKVSSDTKAKEIALKQSKKVEMLENRLEVITKRFNTVVTYNGKLRNEIDAMLKERTQFTSMWNKLISRLDAGKQIINDLIEQATVTFNQRDEELNKIHALREKGMRDMKGHMSEMAELKRTLNNEMKLQNFLGIKGQYRETGDLNMKMEAKRQAEKLQEQNKIAVYMQILQQIKEFTGENDIDKLQAYYIKQEEENFALFNYVNELNDELESLQVRVDKLKDAIRETQNLKDDQGKEQTTTIDKLAMELDDQVKRSDEAESEYTMSKTEIEKLLSGIEALFKALKCDDTPLLGLLGDNDIVTINNVMLYLGIIEKHITDMFHKVYWADKNSRSQRIRLDENDRPRLRPPAVTKIVPTTPCSLCIEKEEMQIVIEGTEEPLTLDDAKEKLHERLQDDCTEILHNVSNCHLPAARRLIQRRYQ